MADYIVAKRWLLSLAQLTAVRLSHDEASAFIETTAPMLAMRFPNEALTPASLEAVAAECKYLPSYGEIVPLLRGHWQQHRPLPPLLPPPPSRHRDEPTEDEREHVARLTAETIAALRSTEQPPEQRRFAANCLSREQLTAAYQREQIRSPRVGAAP
jgi:hypothetical protein